MVKQLVIFNKGFSLLQFLIFKTFSSLFSTIGILLEPANNEYNMKRVCMKITEEQLLPEPLDEVFGETNNFSNLTAKNDVDVF